MVLWNFDLLWKNYETIVLYRELSNFDLWREKKHGKLLKTKKLWIIMEQTMLIYQKKF